MNPQIQSLCRTSRIRLTIYRIRKVNKIFASGWMDGIFGLSYKKVPNLFHSKEVAVLIVSVTKWKVQEFNFHCDINSIKLEDLQYLEAGSYMRMWTLSEYTVFPPNLKDISLNSKAMTMTRKFFGIVTTL